MGGLEVLEWINKNNIKIPTILQTGIEDKKEIEKAKREMEGGKEKKNKKRKSKTKKVHKKGSKSKRTKKNNSKKNKSK